MSELSEKIGDKNDVYAVFAAMLKNAKMPNAFDDLMAACDGFDLMDEPTATEEE